MLEQAQSYGQGKLAKSSAQVLGLAISAGAFIGLGFVFYATVMTGNGDLPWGLSRLVGGLVFSVGLILVVICGGELFTSSVLTVIPWCRRHSATTRVLKNWGLVYLGNAIGALGLVALVMLGNLYALADGQWGLTVLKLAQHKLHHPPLQAIALGVLCNLMVCLAVWMTFSADNGLAKAVLVMLPVALFISTGFEHCIANLFLVPLAIAILQWAPDAYWLSLGLDAGQFFDITLANFIGHNLLPVTLGNILGGALIVGLGYQRVLGTPADKATPQDFANTNYKENTPC